MLSFVSVLCRRKNDTDAFCGWKPSFFESKSDVHSRQMDLRECEQLAYSEIRAAREAECSNSLTSFTSNICVKEKASVATKNMFPEEGRKCVCDVFDRAIHDLAPFSESGKKYPPFNNWTSNIKSSSGSPISPTSSNETKQPWASER